MALCLLWLCSAGGLHLSAAPSSGPLQILNHGAACFFYSPMSGVWPVHHTSLVTRFRAATGPRTTRTSEGAHPLFATKHLQDSRQALVKQTTICGEQSQPLPSSVSHGHAEVQSAHTTLLHRKTYSFPHGQSMSGVVFPTAIQHAPCLCSLHQTWNYCSRQQEPVRTRSASKMSILLLGTPKYRALPC